MVKVLSDPSTHNIILDALVSTSARRFWHSYYPHSPAPSKMTSHSKAPIDNPSPNPAVQDDPSPTESEAWPSSASSTDSPPPPAAFIHSLHHLTYAEAVSKGHKLLDLLSTRPTSHFTSTSTLKSWDYTTTVHTIFPHHQDIYALLQLISPGGTPDAKMITSVRMTSTFRDGTVSPETNAWFVNTIDLKNGVMIAESSHGPCSR